MQKINGLGEGARVPIFWLRVVGSGRFLVEANHISRGITEPCSDLGCVRADRLHNFAAVGDNALECRRDTIHHDVNHEAGGRRRTAENPATAYFPGGVVEGEVTIAALANSPAEHATVKFGGARYVGGGDFEVADSSVCSRGRHGALPKLRFYYAATVKSVAALEGLFTMD